MEYIERYFILIAVFLVALGIAIAVSCIKRELALHKRKRISYENYQKYKKYFVFEPSVVPLILGSAYLVLLLVVSFLILRNDVLRIYLAVLGLMCFVVAIGLSLYYTSERYNKDLSEFDSIYESINSSYVNKQKLLELIAVLKNRRDEISKEVQKLDVEFEKLVEDYKGIDGIQDADKPLREVIEAQEAIANGFDNTMIGIFTSSLHDYLKTGTLSSHTYNRFNPITGVEVDKICSEIRAEIKRLFFAFTISVFESSRLRDNHALIKITDVLRSNGLYKDDYTQIILAYSADHEQNRGDVVNYLYNNALVNYSVLLICEEKKYDFIFDRSLNKYITEKELIEFVALIISKNNYRLANKYVVFCTKADCDGIKNALSIANASNKTADMFDGYYKLLQLDSGYNNVSTRYESIALTLRDYFARNNMSMETLGKVISDETYLENASSLDALYNRALSDIRPVLDKCFDSLLFYFIYGKDCIEQVQEDKVKWLFVEYKKRLNVRGLLCLSALLDGLLLIKIKEKANAKNVCDSILSRGNLCKDFEYYPITQNSNGNYGLYGREIIANLYRRENLPVLKNVIMHVESRRLTLDAFRTI